MHPANFAAAAVVFTACATPEERAQDESVGLWSSTSTRDEVSSKVERVSPKLSVPITFPDVPTSQTTVTFSSAAQGSIRLLLSGAANQHGSERRGGVCRTLGGSIPSGVHCRALGQPIATTAHPLLSLAPDAKTWVLDPSSETGSFLRDDAGSSLSVRGFYSQGFAYVDADGIVRGQSGGHRLILNQSGEPREQQVSGIAERTAFMGDLALVGENGALRVQRIAKDGTLADLVEIPQVERIGSVKACHDGRAFGFLSYGGGEAVAAIPSADGGLDISRVKVDVDAVTMDGRAASISCRPGELTLTWLSTDSRVKQVVCTTHACVARESAAVRGENHLAVIPAVVLDLAGQVLLVRYVPRSLGVTDRIVYRLASIETVHEVSDRLLIAEGPNGVQPRELFYDPKAQTNGDCAVVAVSSADGFYLFRVDKDGSAEGLSAE